MPLLTKKQKRALAELVLGLILGVPSGIEVFKMIFEAEYQSGNNLAVVGIFCAVFVGVILTFDSIATLLGFRNLGELIDGIFYEED